MTIRTATPALLSSVRALKDEGIELGRTDTPLDEDAAAVALQNYGYVDVHVGRTVDERLTIKQVQAIQAIHEGRDRDLPATSRELLANMREIERHDYRFVMLNGQSSSTVGFGAMGSLGKYRAFYQTTIPTTLAFAQLDSGLSYNSEGVWGYQTLISTATPEQVDGGIDRYLDSAYFSRSQVAVMANALRSR